MKSTEAKIIASTLDSLEKKIPSLEWEHQQNPTRFVGKGHNIRIVFQTQQELVDAGQHWSVYMQLFGAEIRKEKSKADLANGTMYDCARACVEYIRNYSRSLQQIAEAIDKMPQTQDERSFERAMLAAFDSKDKFSDEDE